MNKKYNIPMLFITFTLLVSSFLILTKSITNQNEYSLAQFNEVINPPEQYRILDFDKWTGEKSPANVSQVENSSITVIEEDTEVVQKITNILNEKTLTPIIKEEFDINYSDLNDNVKFWLYAYIESEASNKNFYPYNVFIDKNLNLYVETEKAGDYRYLKSSITEDEYKLIEDLYNTLFKQKEVA